MKGIKITTYTRWVVLIRREGYWAMVEEKYHGMKYFAEKELKIYKYKRRLEYPMEKMRMKVGSVSISFDDKVK